MIFCLDIPNSLWIIITGMLVAIPCSLLGCFLVLRKTVMVGDAISHAVLPGIVIAYMITQSFSSVPILIGAGILGMITTFLVEFFHKKGKLQSDASIGVTFTWLFALGVILISVYTRDTDLDQNCVLYGEIIAVPINVWITDAGVNMGPIAVWFLSIITLFVITYIVIGYKELFLTTFDPEYAAAIGISTAFWHYSLMGTVSFVTVGSFESVGAILVVAFLVAPAATAYLLTNNLKTMLFLAVLFGILSAIGGYFLAEIREGISTSGAMTVVAGLLFTLALLLSPSQGTLTRRFRTKTKNVA